MSQKKGSGLKNGAINLDLCSYILYFCKIGACSVQRPLVV